MDSWIDRFSRYCIAKNYISSADYLWFKYGLEKRFYTLVVAIPFFFLAVIITNIYTAFAFFICFYCLRSRTNGFHANTVWLCFTLSLLCEVVFLAVINPLLNTVGALVLAIASSIIIFILAPYNHPNMHLSTKEIAACRISARIRSCFILLGVFVCCILDTPTIAKGCSLGLAMAACLLCLAYILERRKTLNEDSAKSH